MRLLFLGGTGPVGMSASRIALARGHEVVVAHSGKHEPGDLSVRHLHGERDELLAPGGPAARARADVIVDTRTTAENLRRCSGPPAPEGRGQSRPVAPAGVELGNSQGGAGPRVRE